MGQVITCVQMLFIDLKFTDGLIAQDLEVSKKCYMIKIYKYYRDVRAVISMEYLKV